jgi:type II secretory pathway pseudopilin PulG
MQQQRQTRCGRPRAGQAGITLIELLVTMIILTVVSTMLVGGWISLQRAYAFTSADNLMRATARDAVDRISSEIRTAQPPTATSKTPFYFAGVTPYVCDGYHCVFWSAYNNTGTASNSGTDGLGRVALTAIWLDSATRKLWWQRDTSGNGVLGDPADRTVLLAKNVVNAALSMPVFAYNFRDASGTYTQPQPPSLTSANVVTLVSVQVEVVVDTNVNHTPMHIDVRTTVEPRNQSGS